MSTRPISSLRPLSNNRLSVIEPQSFLTFDSSTDGVTVASPSNINFSNNFTISIALRLNNTSQATTFIFKKASGGSTGYAVVLNYTLGFAELFVSGYTGSNPGFNGTASRIPLADYLNHVLTWTYDGTTLKGYVDGVLVLTTTITFSLSANAGSLYVGGNASGVANTLMDLSEFRLYNVALEATEIMAIALKRANVRPTACKLWWKFDEATGTTLTDASGNGNNGTIANATWGSELLALPNLRETLYTIGDSVTSGSGASTEDQKYISLVAKAKRLRKVNHAVSGTSILRHSAQVFLHLNPTLPVKNRDQYLMMSGYNDMRFFGTNATHLGYYTENLYANIVWCAIQDRFKVYGQDTRNLVTYTGSWSNETSFAGIGKTSSTLGDTATFKAYGSVVYICSLAVQGGTGRFSVTVDGVSKGTFNCYNSDNDSSSNNHPFLVRLTGLSVAEHTVVITVAVAAGATAFYFGTANGGLRESNRITSSEAPTVYVGNMIYMTTAGYAVVPSSGSNAAVDLYNVQTLAVCTALKADGLNVEHVDVNANFPAIAGNFNADLVHPSNAGHQLIADAFNAVMTNRPSRPTAI